MPRTRESQLEEQEVLERIENTPVEMAYAPPMPSEVVDMLPLSAEAKDELRGPRLDEIVWVECPLYPGFRVGYAINNRYEVAELYRQLPPEAPDAVHYALAARIIRTFEGWRFGKPKVEMSSRKVRDPLTGEEREMEVLMPVLDERGRLMLEPIPQPDPDSPATFDSIPTFDVNLWQWVRFEGYEQALEQMARPLSGN
jgi:hypothetical protein